jgi:hypothetical protein
MATKGTQPVGILYRTPTGDLYFRADYQDEPHLIPADKKKVIEARAKEKGLAHFVENDLPEDVLKLINDLLSELGFGPVVGAWWVWGP